MARQPLAFRTSRKKRFYRCGPHVVRTYQTKPFWCARDFSSRQLLNIQRSLSALREAGTLPRSPRIKWGAGTPDVPLQLPSGTESMLMNAALARLHASSSDAWRYRLA